MPIHTGNRAPQNVRRGQVAVIPRKHLDRLKEKRVSVESSRKVDKIGPEIGSVADFGPDGSVVIDLYADLPKEGWRLGRRTRATRWQRSSNARGSRIRLPAGNGGRGRLTQPEGTG